MWTRELLKTNAKSALKNYYWLALGVSALAFILDGTEEGNSIDYSGAIEGFANMLPLMMNEDSDVVAASIAALMLVLFAVVIGLVLNFAIYAFVCGPILVGKCSFFSRAREGDARFGNLFSAFGSGRYMGTVKVMFFYHFYTAMWSLLFVIPGVIKGLEYYLIPYLLAENPNLSKERAFEISRRTMDGEKWNLFVLQLSFIGWYLLGLLACCVGTYAVLPYEHATYAEFYACMRAKMLAHGITTEEELTGTYTY